VAQHSSTIFQGINMSLPSQIFLLFYAVLYGVLFTLSDRWRPFFSAQNEPHGWRRLIISLVLFGLLPVTYFLLAMQKMTQASATDLFHLGIAIYAVAPLGFFYVLWLFIVVPRKDFFYTPYELNASPVKDSLDWVGVNYPSKQGIIFWAVLFFVIPYTILLLI
jgi:hypothetical protein